MSSSDLYGTVVSRGDVEQAVITTLYANPPGGSAPRLVYYLAEAERRNGLKVRTLPVPPSVDSYRGGMDFETFREDAFPLLIVTVTPDGQPDPMDTYVYGQAFLIRIAAVVEGKTEDEARSLADIYGAWVAKLIGDNGRLGSLGATSSTPQTYPTPEFIDPDRREILRTVVAFRTLVAPVLTQGGPSVFPPNPYTTPGDWPTVETVDTTLTVVPITQPV